MDEKQALIARIMAFDPPDDLRSALDGASVEQLHWLANSAEAERDRYAALGFVDEALI